MARKLTPVSYKSVVKIFEADGYIKSRQKGSHICMTKAAIARPLVIPAHKEVSVGVISALLRTSGMSRERFFKLLDDV